MKPDISPKCGDSSCEDVCDVDVASVREAEDAERSFTFDTADYQI